MPIYVFLGGSYEGKSLKVGIFDREVVLKRGGVMKKHTGSVCLAIMLIDL